jgi:Holliday junction DNA helicase RuvA
MIAHLTGTLLRKTPQSVIIDNGGIGYEVLVPLSTFYSLPEKNETVSLHIHTHVREDALTLFGFLTLLEKEIFLMLVSVSGIGPKLAINILSGIGPDDLLEAIAQGDVVRLRSIPGVGKKMSERIALEVSDRALSVGAHIQRVPPPVIAGEDRGLLEDAQSALLNLGYPARSAKSALDKALAESKGKGTLEELIKEALKLLM